jgi:hypothetical protein
MRENYILLAGYRRREKKAFELMRMQAFVTAKFSGNLKNKNLTVEQFLPSPYEEVKPAKIEDNWAKYERQQAELEEARKTKKKEVPKQVLQQFVNKK